MTTATQDTRCLEEERAADLLGLSVAELRRLSRLAGLGRLAKNGSDGQMIFRQDELRKLCLLGSSVLG